MAVDALASMDAVALHVVGRELSELEPVERATVKAVCEAANALVSRYVEGSDVPETVCKAAVLRLAYFDYHTRFPITAAPEVLRVPARRGTLNPLRSSGAMALLSPYKRRHAAPCEAGQ